MLGNREIKDTSSESLLMQAIHEQVYTLSFNQSVSDTDKSIHDNYLVKLLQISNEEPISQLTNAAKNCNNAIFFKNEFGYELCTPLSLFLGFNPGHVLYEPAISMLLQCPNILLTPFCGNNLYFYPVKTGNISLIKRLQAFGVQVTPQIIADCFNAKSIPMNSFLACPVNMNDETIKIAKKTFGSFESVKQEQNAEISLDAFKQLLNGGNEIDFFNSSVPQLFNEYKDQNDTPTSIIAKILESSDKNKNEFLNIILNEIKLFILNSIEKKKITNLAQLEQCLDSIAGFKGRPKYHEIRNLLENEIKSFAEPFFDLRTLDKVTPEKIDNKLSLRIALFNKKLRQQEAKDQKLLAQCIKEGHFGMIQMLVKSVNYLYQLHILNKLIKNEAGIKVVDRIGIIRIMLTHFNQIGCDREYGKIILNAVKEKDYDLAAILFRHVQNNINQNLLTEYRKKMKKNQLITPEVWTADFSVVLKNILFGKEYGNIPKVYLENLSEHLYLFNLRYNINNLQDFPIFVNVLTASNPKLLYTIAAIYYQEGYLSFFNNDRLMASNNFMYAAEFLLEFANFCKRNQAISYVAARTFYIEAKTAEVSQQKSHIFLPMYTTALLYLVLSEVHDYRDLPILITFIKRLVESMSQEIEKPDMVQKIINHLVSIKSKLTINNQLSDLFFYTKSDDKNGELHKKFSQLCINELINLLNQKINKSKPVLEQKAPAHSNQVPSDKTVNPKPTVEAVNPKPTVVSIDPKPTEKIKKQGKKQKQRDKEKKSTNINAQPAALSNDSATQLKLKYAKILERKQILLARLALLSQTEVDCFNRTYVDNVVVGAEDNIVNINSANKIEYKLSGQEVNPTETSKSSQAYKLFRMEEILEIENQCNYLEAKIVEVNKKQEEESEKLKQQRKLKNRQDKLSANLQKTNDIRQLILERNQKKQNKVEERKVKQDERKLISKSKNSTEFKKSSKQTKSLTSNIQTSSNSQTTPAYAEKKSLGLSSSPTFFKPYHQSNPLKYAFKWFNHSFVYLKALYDSAKNDINNDINFYALLFHLARFAVTLNNSIKEFDDAKSEIKQSETDNLRQILLHRGMLSVDRDIVFTSSSELIDLMRRQLSNLRKPHLTGSLLSVNQSKKLNEMKINVKKNVHSISELEIYQILIDNTKNRKLLDESIVRSIFINELAPTLKSFYNELKLDPANININYAIANILFICGELFEAYIIKKGKQQAAVIEDQQLQNFYGLLALCKEFRNKASHEINIAIVPFVAKCKPLFERCINLTIEDPSKSEKNNSNMSHNQQVDVVSSIKM